MKNGDSSGGQGGGEAAISKSGVYAQMYMGLVAVVVSVLVAVVFWQGHEKTATLIERQILHEARALFQEIVLVRRWVAAHVNGGVLVEAERGESPNPFLVKMVGEKASRGTVDGATLILKNPALVTKELSLLGHSERLFTFHITSLNPVNPANAPDGFEKKALEDFASNSGIDEIYRLDTAATEPVFRYMAPLVTEQPCLKCHASQGYKVGDIRGGISVTIPAGDIAAELQHDLWLFFFAAAVIIAVILLFLSYVSYSFSRALNTNEAMLCHMATRDFLTGLLNRREGVRRFSEELDKTKRSGRSLSTILFDIDHFKKVNDTYGHQAGDDVLVWLARSAGFLLRSYDILFRYGGEEFMIILPDASEETAMEIAERLRRRVAATPITISGVGTISITISLGVTVSRSGDEMESMTARTDEALYAAKQAGRNRVVLSEGQEGV